MPAPSRDDRLLARARVRDVEETLQVQHRVILRAQAIAAGMSRIDIDRLVRAGKWRPVLRGALTDAPTVTDKVIVSAAWLWGGPGAVVGGAAALRWTGLLDAASLPSDHLPAIDLYVPRSRSRVTPAGLRLRRAILPSVDWTWQRGIRVTTATRTCIDLARWGAPCDYFELALRRHRTQPDQIAQTLVRLRRHGGYGRAARAAEEVLSCPWSPPERALHIALRDAGATGWVGNLEVRTSRGKLFVDIAFPDVKLAIEIKGRRYHAESIDPQAFERDHRREQALIDLGWQVLSFTATQIEEDLQGVLATILRRVALLRAM